MKLKYVFTTVVLVIFSASAFFPNSSAAAEGYTLHECLQNGGHEDEWEDVYFHGIRARDDEGTAWAYYIIWDRWWGWEWSRVGVWRGTYGEALDDARNAHNADTNDPPE